MRYGTLIVAQFQLCGAAACGLMALRIADISVPLSVVFGLACVVNTAAATESTMEALFGEDGFFPLFRSRGG